MRKHGYYWVKECTEWHVALWNSYFEKWYFCGSENAYKDSNFEEIGEKVEHK